MLVRGGYDEVARIADPMLSMTNAYEQNEKDDLLAGRCMKRIGRERKKPSRIIKIMRYAAILILPIAVAAYVLLNQENVTKPQIVSRNQVEEKVAIPIRKQPMLVLEDGSVLQLQRGKGEKEITSNAVSNGNELVYSKKDSLEKSNEVEYNTVVVPKGGEYHVVLADGTKVWFNEETSLKFR